VGHDEAIKWNGALDGTEEYTGCKLLIPCLLCTIYVYFNCFNGTDASIFRCVKGYTVDGTSTRLILPLISARVHDVANRGALVNVGTD